MIGARTSQKINQNPPIQGKRYTREVLKQPREEGLWRAASSVAYGGRHRADGVASGGGHRGYRYGRCVFLWPTATSEDNRQADR